MDTATFLNAAGLILDAGGAAFMFFYPPPPDFEDAGGDPIGPNDYFDKVRAERREQFKKSSFVSRWSMAVIAIGFRLQLIAIILS
jgi:hypothetical protein